MLDPFSIATGCLSLVNGITNLTMHITLFVNEVRGARKDMDMIHRELTSLSLSLGALGTDCRSGRVDYPEASRKGIETALVNIDVLTQQIKDLLQKLSSGRLGRRIQWSLESKDTVNRLRSSLETQKSTIEIALQCGSIQILCAIQKSVEKPAQDFTRLTSNTQAIRDNTQALRRDAQDIQNQLRQDREVLHRGAVDIKELIRQEASVLRAEIEALKRDKPPSSDLQDFLKLSQEYSNRITDPFTTPARSDAETDTYSLRAASSRSSVTLTSNPSIDLDKTPGPERRDGDAVLTCTSCGQQIPSNSEPTDDFVRELLSALENTGPPAPEGTVKVVVKCENDGFTMHLDKDAGLPAVQEWIFSVLAEAEAKEESWVDGIKKPEHIKLKIGEGPKYITYPGDTLSDLARIYGSGSTLELETPFVRRANHDSFDNLKITTETDYRTVYLNLKNDNHFRPIAWCFKTDDCSTHQVYDNREGGIIPPSSSTRTVGHAKMRTSKAYPFCPVILAVLIRPEDNQQHWKRLILTKPTTERGAWYGMPRQPSELDRRKDLYGRDGYILEFKKVDEQESADLLESSRAMPPRYPPAPAGHRRAEESQLGKWLQAITGPPAERPVQSRRQRTNRTGEDDAEMRLAIEASKYEAEEENKRRAHLPYPRR